MRKNFVPAAFLVILTLAFAAPVFAEAEGTVFKTVEEAELAVMDEWVAPRAKGNPRFWFYENRRLSMSIREDDEAWDNLDFLYDPEKSEYLISDNRERCI